MLYQITVADSLANTAITRVTPKKHTTAMNALVRHMGSTWPSQDLSTKRFSEASLSFSDVYPNATSVGKATRVTLRPKDRQRVYFVFKLAGAITIHAIWKVHPRTVHTSLFLAEERFNVENPMHTETSIFWPVMPARV
jgi:hypothetical protein